MVAIAATVAVMPTARPTSAGTAAAGLLALHELRTRMDNDRQEASEAPFWLARQSQSDLLSEQVETVFAHALSAASEVVAYELYRDIRSGVAALLAESTEPAAVEALARMTTRWTVVDDELCRTNELEVDVDPDTDDMGSTFAQLLAIGLANRAGIGVRWLVQRAREVDDWADNGKDAARWADIGAVLGITPQAAAKRFGDNQSISPRGPIEAALAPVLADAMRKRL